MSRTLNITNPDELTKIIKSEDSVLIDFYAEWCNPCKMLSPRLEELSFKYENVKFVKIDFDKSREIADAYGIKHMPTVIGFCKGKILDELIGFDDLKISALADKLSSNFLFIF
jgi:thioredoxin 1